ncbi:MAG: nucleotidyltransferase domain-containing protein [Nanoarchaeota archaeon]|nr:nucleotidyltransferase domain-containing protein [Nanoarchaeota archaeon]
MDFTQKKRLSSNQEKYHIENLKIARDFSRELILEMKNLVKSIILFGSNTQNTLKKDSDIDIMVVLDNISVFVSPELKEAYRVISQKLVENNSSRLHIMTVNFSDLWDMARKGDPVLINVLRFGTPIFDRDIIEPLQYLLEIGKIKPTRETAYNYMARSQTLLDETKKHIHEAVLDLYYAIIDMVHSTLIIEKVEPKSPKEMPTVFEKTFKNNKQISKFSSEIKEFYKLAKDLEYGKVSDIKGSEYEKLEKKARNIITTLKTYNDKKLNNSDIFDL